MGRTVLIPAEARPAYDELVQVLRVEGPAPCTLSPSPELWWASTAPLVKRAQAGCALCPAARECLEYAIAANEREGVWGGTTPADRREVG